MTAKVKVPNGYFLILNILLIGLQCSSKPIVKTNWGYIKGLYQNFDGTQIRSFLGIPYALPPVGPLRFAKPIPFIKPYSGIYNANQFGPACLQTEFNGAIHSPNSTISENCLFLNIWTPLIGGSSHKLLPVFVYIHGSSFTFGSAAGPRSRGDVLTAHTGIVTVNLNHRLGATGWAYGGSDHIVGNEGIHDVLLAMKWIKSNIKAFGGDPDQITLGGMSSGAIISSAVFLTPALKENLFNKVVLMSGVAIDHINTDEPSKLASLTKSMSKSLGCAKNNETFDMNEIICLKKVNSKAIANTVENSIFKLVFGDRYIFPVSPNTIINNGQFPRGFKFLVGTEADEALFGRNVQPSNKSEAIGNLTALIQSIKFPSSLNITDLPSKYFEDVNDTDVALIQRRYIDFISDFQFHCPCLLFSLSFARNDANMVYFYRNDYVTSYFPPESRPYGAAHADDHRLFLGEPFRSPEMYSNDQDRKLSEFMMKILSDFIRGKPMFWPPIKVKTGRYSKNISLPRWRIQNNEKFDKIDYDEDKDICLEWSRYLGLKI